MFCWTLAACSYLPEPGNVLSVFFICIEVIRIILLLVDSFSYPLLNAWDMEHAETTMTAPYLYGKKKYCVRVWQFISLTSNYNKIMTY